MNALVFLGIALVLSLAGCLVLWFRSRQPGSMEAHIRDFARELDALAPGSPGARMRGRQGTRDERDPGPLAQGPPHPPQRTVQPRPRPRPGPERPLERGSGPERPLERGSGPERPLERGSGPERPPEQGTEGRAG